MATRNRLSLLVLLGAAAVLILFGPALVGVYVDWLWFAEVGQRPVFTRLVGTQALLGVAFGIALTGLVFLNLTLARRFAPRLIPRRDAPEWSQAVAVLARQGLTGMFLAGSLALGGVGGLVAASRWDDWLRFRNPEQFGVVDPLFKTDIGFYVFQYPFLHFLSGWLFGTLLLAAVATLVVYYMDGAFGMSNGQLRVPEAVRAHLSVLLGLLFLAKGWDFWLDRFGLLLQKGGVVFGAGYTDVHARLAALNILAVVAVIAAVGFFLNARLRVLWLPGLAVAVMVVAGLTVGTVYPGLVQRLVVAPDEQSRERPYIEHHLQATRRAYGLDAIEPVEYSPTRELSSADVGTERQTLDNIRLWDYRLLGRTYQRLQGLRQYYDVSDVDIDRYTINGRYRQVMLAPRELVTDRLQQRRWVNETLQYTHGYGLVMSAVSEADPSGRPTWLIRDLPLATPPDLKVTRPQLYFGMQEQHPVVAPSKTEEFDYPTETKSFPSSYGGDGGIEIGSAWRQFVFSLFLGDWNLSISDQVRPDSRILIRRQVRDRVARLAPFLRYDGDPYLVVSEGKLVWLLDAYTTATTYPYSEPVSLGTEATDEVSLRSSRPLSDPNYLRNSVKVTVDGYTGKVTFYAMDETDPVLRSYRRAFTGLFTPGAEMPPALRAHIRYPEDLFSLQVRKLTRFHVTDANVFYGRSDVWQVPSERVGEQEGAESEPMQPYYVLIRLPGEKELEFALTMPFRTRAGTTMPGWLVARSDGESYGRLRIYRFPTASQVDAPDQVDNAIVTDPQVSSQVALWNRSGSKVRYGNLLVVPVASSLLYVKPLYLEGTQGGQGGIPELKQVILAEKRGAAMRVVMQPTLRQALAELVGAPVSDAPRAPAADETPPDQPAPQAGGSIAALAAEAERAFSAAEQALRGNNWAEYGRQIERARSAVRRLRSAAGGTGDTQ